MGMLPLVRRTGGRRPRSRAVRRRIRRLAGWIAADGNPLRRRVDRIEASVKVILVVAFLVLAPLLAPVAWHLATADGMRQVRQERSWREVRAVLLRSAPQESYGYGSMASFWVPARWTAPDGVVRSGLVPVRAGLPAGGSERIWVSQTGQITGRQPMTTRLVSFRATLVALGTVAGLLVLAFAVMGVVRAMLNRRRMACWAIEWASFGPRWSARRPPPPKGS